MDRFTRRDAFRQNNIKINIVLRSDWLAIFGNSNNKTHCGIIENSKTLLRKSNGNLCNRSRCGIRALREHESAKAHEHTGNNEWP